MLIVQKQFVAMAELGGRVRVATHLAIDKRVVFVTKESGEKNGRDVWCDGGTLCGTVRKPEKAVYVYPSHTGLKHVKVLCRVAEWLSANEWRK